MLEKPETYNFGIEKKQIFCNKGKFFMKSKSAHTMIDKEYGTLIYLPAPKINKSIESSGFYH